MFCPQVYAKYRSQNKVCSNVVRLIVEQSVLHSWPSSTYFTPGFPALQYLFVSSSTWSSHATKLVKSIKYVMQEILPIGRNY